MTKKEKEEFNLLYEYVRSSIMGYDSNQSLSRDMVLRLKGLSTNQFIINNKGKNKANYSYNVILNTFKICKPEIIKGINNNSFNNEMHKFNYILKIVEHNLNDVYLRMNKVKQSENEIENIDMANATGKTTYQPKTDHVSSKFDDLW